jgi:hypothetical protein
MMKKEEEGGEKAKKYRDKEGVLTHLGWNRLSAVGGGEQETSRQTRF